MRLVPRLVVCAVLFAACRNSTAPILGAVYVLRSIDSQPLPAPYAENAQLPNRMFADTLILGDHGRGEWRIVVEDSFGGTKLHIVDDLLYTGTDHIEVNFICPPNADCIAGPHLSGNVTSTGIVFSVSRVTRAPLVFERIEP